MSATEPLRPEADELEAADRRTGSVQKRLAWLAVLLVVAGVGVGLFGLSKSGEDDSVLPLSDRDQDVTGDSVLPLSDGDVGGGESLLLLSHREDDGDQYFLVRPGEQPGPVNLLETPDSFRPADSFADLIVKPWLIQASGSGRRGFTENGQYLVGSGNGTEGSFVTAIDTSSGERNDILVGESIPRVYVAEVNAIVEVEISESKEYFLFDPSASGELVDLGPADEIVFSPDGRFVALLADGDGDVFETSDGGAVLSSSFNEFAFAPDGEHVVFVNDRGIELYDLPTGEVEFMDVSFDDEQVQILWNDGEAFVVRDGIRDAVLISADGRLTELSPYKEAHFVSMSSRDLVVFRNEADQFPTYFSAETEETVQIDGLSVHLSSGIILVVLVDDPSTGGYSEVMNLGGTGNIVNRLHIDGALNLLETDPEYSLNRSVLVGDTTFFAFNEYVDDPSGGEDRSGLVRRVKLFAERDGSIAEVLTVEESEIHMVTSLDQLFLITWDPGRRNPDQAPTLFLLDSDGAQELGQGGSVTDIVIVGETIFYTRTEDDEASVLSAEVGAGLAEPYAPGYRLVAAYIGD